jgi:hypothetical protein
MEQRGYATHKQIYVEFKFFFWKKQIFAYM